MVSTDPDGTVRVRSKVLSLLAGGLCGSGTYDDVAVRTTDGWRISRRVIGLRASRPAPPATPPGAVIPVLTRSEVLDNVYILEWRPYGADTEEVDR